MKLGKKNYWVATIFFSLWMTMNAYAYLATAQAKQLCAHFGFPDYFRIELAFAKIIGVIVLLLPAIRGACKEWTYAGFAITVVSGFIAHCCSGDAFMSSVSALLALAVLITSYIAYHQSNHTHHESSSHIPAR